MKERDSCRHVWPLALCDRECAKCVRSPLSGRYAQTLSAFLRRGSPSACTSSPVSVPARKDLNQKKCLVSSANCVDILVRGRGGQEQAFGYVRCTQKADAKSGTSLASAAAFFSSAPRRTKAARAVVRRETRERDAMGRAIRSRTAYGHKGATLQHPGWAGATIGFQLFPTAMAPKPVANECRHLPPKDQLSH